MERFPERCPEDGRVFHQIVVLGTMARDSNRVAFLESVRPNQAGGYLSGNYDKRDGVHPCVRDARDGIRRAGPRSDENHAGLTGRSGVAFCRVHRTALLPDENVTDAILLEQCIVNRENGTARIAEYELDAEVMEGSHQDLSAAALL